MEEFSHALVYFNFVYVYQEQEDVETTGYCRTRGKAVNP